MNCAAQECTKICTGRETPATAPKMLLVFVSHAAPSTINVSLSTISLLLEDNTSLSTSYTATNKQRPLRRGSSQRPSSSAPSALLGLVSLKLDDLIPPVVVTVRRLFAKKKHKQHFITEITAFPWIASSRCQKRLLWCPPDTAQHCSDAGEQLEGWPVPLHPSSSPHRPSCKERRGKGQNYKLVIIISFK